MPTNIFIPSLLELAGFLALCAAFCAVIVWLATFGHTQGK